MMEIEKHLKKITTYTGSFVNFSLTIFAIVVTFRFFGGVYFKTFPLILFLLPLFFSIFIMIILETVKNKRFRQESNSTFIFGTDSLYTYFLQYPYNYFWLSFAFSVYFEVFLFPSHASALVDILIIQTDYFNFLSEIFLIPVIFLFILLGMPFIFYIGKYFKIALPILFFLMFIPMLIGVGLLLYLDYNPDYKQWYMLSIKRLIGVIYWGWGYMIFDIIRKIFLLKKFI